MTDAFRAEVRDWLAAHGPAGPLPSLDTAEGFERHRAWERELAAARLSVVTWPAAYGGRDVLGQPVPYLGPERLGHPAASLMPRASSPAR